MKPARQAAILTLVREREIHTQQDLAAALAEHGFAATQATVSRDIQELGLVRGPDGYRVSDTRSRIVDLVLSMRQVEFLLVIQTPPGTANMVARAMDEAELDGVAGTLAGDDTIIVVLTGRGAAEPVRRFLSG